MGLFATKMWPSEKESRMATIRKRYRNRGKPNEKLMGFELSYVDQHKKRHLKLFKLKGDAKAYLKKAEPEVDQGIHVADRESLTVAVAAELWLQNCRVNKLKSATLRQYGNHVRIHIVPAIGTKKLSELSRPQIEKLKDKWLGSMSRAMTVKVLVSLKAIIDEAIRIGRHTQNPARGVVVKQLAQDEPEEITLGGTVPRKDEFNRILAVVEGTRWHSVIATAGLAGLRSSELRALRWSDIDFDAGLINVRRRADENGKIDRPKSRAGSRAVLLSKDLAQILRQWRLACPRNGDGMVDLCFPTGIGTVESHANIANRGFYAAQRELDPPMLKPKIEDGVPVLDKDGNPVMQPKYGLHALRHFYAWLIIEQNYNPKRVQQLLGHASLQMSYDRYGGLFAATADEHAKMSEATKFLHATK
jgi:integrase